MSRQQRQLVIEGTKLVAFLLTMVLLVAVLVVTLGDIHPGTSRDYRALFRDVSGLASGNEVRVASVTAGRVESVDVAPSGTVTVRFSLTDDVALTSSSTATVRYKNLVGDRYLDLAPGLRPGPALRAGGVLDTSHTSAALDLDALLGGFKPLFVGLSPAQINALSSQLVGVLQGEQGAVYRLVETLASFTSTIATREQVIGRVVTNLNTVLGSLDADGGSVGTIVDQLTTVVAELSARGPEVLDATQQIDRMAADTADLAQRARPSLQSDVSNLRAVATSLAANAGTLQSVLSAWPQHYAALLRSGSYGDFFNFFLCGVRLQFTPDGAPNPVQTPWLSSAASRCQR